MANPLSPGVYTNEIDFSQYAPALSTSSLVLVGPCTKGPFNTPTLITNVSTLVEKFGIPNGNHYMMYAAQEYLRNGRQLYIIRIGDGSEAPAKIQLGGLSQVATLKGTVDLSRGVDLSGARKKLNIDIEGTVVEFDASAGAASATSVTIDEIIANIEAEFAVGNAGKNKLGQNLYLWGDTAGIANSIQVLDTADSAENAAQLIFGYQTFPVTATGLNVSANVWTVNFITNGTDGNGYRVLISQGSEVNSSKIQVYSATGVLLETHDNLTDANVLSLVNGVSQYITITRNATPTGNIPSPALFGESPTVTPILNFLTGGLNGDAALTASHFIGVNTPTSVTGMQTVSDPFQFDINLISAPDMVNLTAANHVAVALAMLDLCESRSDCFAIIDPPKNLTAQQVVDWHNGQGAFNTHQALNSSYGAVYWPYVKIFDSFTNTTFFVPPSGHVASQYAFTDNVSDPWVAPAGLNRGRLLSALALESNPTLGERDFMYSGGNAVNPIVDFVRDGITIWGQRTLQRSSSALDRVNVRRLLLVIRKVISTATKIIVFDPNDTVTQLRAKNIIEPILRNIMARRGLESFNVVLDESINTPDVVNRNEFRGQIFITPVKAAEKIILDFIILPTGAEFSEFTQPNI